jgi:hypothetical protein
VLLTECICGKQPNEFVLTRVVRGKSGQMENQSVRNFRKIWANVCVAAGVGKFVGPKCESPVNTELRGVGFPTKWE